MTEKGYRASLSVEWATRGTDTPRFFVTGFEGIEEISRPYRFDVDLESEDPGIDVAALLHQQATLEFEYGGHRTVRGIVLEASQGGRCRSGRFAYSVVLGPAMMKLDLSRQSQIYGTNGPVNVVDVVESELTGRAALGVRSDAVAHVDPRFLDIRLPRDQYPARDYVVQYQESDLAFICRLMEQRGVFFFFTHEKERETLILGDHNAAFDALGGGRDGRPRAIAYKPPATDAEAGVSTVHTLNRCYTASPARIVLREHNYRGEPGTRRNPEYLQVESAVTNGLHGVDASYDEQFRDFDEGRHLAAVREQAVRCLQDVCRGTGNCSEFAPGHRFELQQHFRTGANTEYLLTRVHHKAGTRLPGDTPRYCNTFSALAADVPFRPQRLTPRPVVPGVFTAYVDASGEGLRALIDDEGRYRIRLPFDLSGAADGTASRYMRMAQPYANFSSPGGDSAGMHFPLLKGTEVVCACVNGNPDRPVILSAIPNPRTKSPVTGTDAAKNRIRTTSGILMEFDDGSPSAKR